MGTLTSQHETSVTITTSPAEGALPLWGHIPFVPLDQCLERVHEAEEEVMVFYSPMSMVVAFNTCEMEAEKREMASVPTLMLCLMQIPFRSATFCKIDKY